MTLTVASPSSTAPLVETPAPRDEWSEIYAGHVAAVAEHSPQWTDAVCAGGSYTDASRLYRFADGRRFVLPLVRRAGARGTGGWYESFPAAWGMGGLVGSGADAAVVAAVLDDLRSLDAMRVSIRIDPLAAPIWDGATDGRLIEIPRFGHVVDLDGGIDGVEARFSKTARNGARKAEKRGVTVELDRTGALLGEHYALYLRSVERWSDRQREPLAMALWRARRRDPLEKLQSMARHLGDAFCHFVAYHEGVPVASTIVLLGPSAHDTRGAMDIDRAAPTRANDLLQRTAIRHAVESGCRWYHFGESGRSASLASFKEKFGAVGHVNHEYRIERVPLTATDAAARTAVKRLIGFRDV